MPNIGDRVVYFWFPLPEPLFLQRGPYNPEIDETSWMSGWLQPSQSNLPRPTLDISLVLLDGHKNFDDFGFSGSIDRALDHIRWLSAPSIWRSVRRLLGRILRKPFLMWRPKVEITVVEAAVTLPPEANTECEEVALHITSAFDSALGLTRQLVLAASMEAHESIPLPALELLPPLVPYVITRKVSKSQLSLEGRSLSLLTNNAHRGVLSEEEAKEEAEKQQAEVPPLLGFPDIYGTYQSLRNDAEVVLRHYGQYRASLILTATAAEALLNTLMGSVLYEEGLDAKDAMDLLKTGSRDGIHSRVRRVLAPRLKGQWDGRSDTAVAHWVEKILQPRNAAIHIGTNVTRLQAQEACGHLHELRRWVGGRVFSQRSRYPYTALAMSLGMMMSPGGTQDDQGGWLLKRLSEIDDDFVSFVEGLPGWLDEVYRV